MYTTDIMRERARELRQAGRATTGGRLPAGPRRRRGLRLRADRTR